MDRMIYTAYNAMRGAMLRQTALAHNLANSATTGFRADMSVARSMWIDGPGLDSRAMASQAVLSADLSPGDVTTTGRDLDLAMRGSALLTVQAPNGDEAYTRRGDLMLTEARLLVTGDGHPVLGENGPITIPPADSMGIDEDGRVWIVPPGGDAGQPEEVGRLKLASPVGSDIVKGVDDLLRVRDGGILPTDVTATLTAGALEGANVSSTDALVSMIEASRAWDSQMQLISTARELDETTSALMQLPD